MADEKDTTEETVESLKQQLNQLKDKSKNAGNTSVIAGLVAFFLAALTVGLLAYKAFKTGRKRTKVLHEAEVKQESLHQKEIEAVLELSEDKKAAIGKSIGELALEIELLRQETETLEKDRADMIKRIDSITSWGDIDEIIK